MTNQNIKPNINSIIQSQQNLIIAVERSTSGLASLSALVSAVDLDKLERHDINVVLDGISYLLDDVTSSLYITTDSLAKQMMLLNPLAKIQEAMQPAQQF